MVLDSSPSPMVLDSSSATRVSDVADAASPPATTKITREAINALHNYFAMRRWPRNKRMPKVNTDGMLDKIISDFNLNRTQASRQLRSWKAKKYDNAQVKIVIDPEDVELSIMEGISMELEDYVSEFLQPSMKDAMSQVVPM